MHKILLGSIAATAFTSASVFAAIKPNALRIDNSLENGELVLHGYFGPMWNAQEIKSLAANECQQNGKTLKSFSTADGKKTGSTTFRATCQ